MNMATAMNFRPEQENVLRAIFEAVNSQHEVTDYSLEVTLPGKTDRTSLDQLARMQMIQFRGGGSEAEISAFLLPKGITSVMQLCQKWIPQSSEKTLGFEEWELA